MSKLHAINNFIDNNWSVDLKNIESCYIDLCIGFSDNTNKVYFNELSFGFELRLLSGIESYAVYPPPNTNYVSTTEKFLVTKRISVQPEQEYSLYLWAKNNGKFSETTVTFTTPALQNG